MFLVSVHFHLLNKQFINSFRVTSFWIIPDTCHVISSGSTYMSRSKEGRLLLQTTEVCSLSCFNRLPSHAYRNTMSVYFCHHIRTKQVTKLLTVYIYIYAFLFLNFKYFGLILRFNYANIQQRDTRDWIYWTIFTFLDTINSKPT